MSKSTATKIQLEQENENLRTRLEEAEQTLHAIYNGEVDALVVSTGHGEQIFTLKGADHSYRVMIENMSEGALTITREGVILYANQRFAVMLRQPLEKVIGSSIIDWVFPPDRVMLQTLLLKENSRRRLAALNLAGGDGAKIPVQLSLINLQLEDVPDQICVSITDLTEHMLAEQALQESEERYRSLVEYANEAIVVIQDGIIKFVNPMAEKIFAGTAVDLTSVPFNDFVHADDRSLILERPLEKLRGGNKNPFHFRLRARDGKIKHIAENSVRIIWGKRPAVLALMADITELQKMEEEMLRSAKLDAVGFLAGSIAHDFNNYLAMFLANISLAKLYGDDVKKIQEKLQNMEKATLRARDLSNQLFTFAQGGAPVKRKICIRQLIADAIKFALSGSPVFPRIFIHEDLYMVEADEGQLSQVLNNIAINALQAMPEGGILEVRAENVIPGTAEHNSVQLTEGPYVKLTLKDEGTGIPQKYLNKIFDPFFTTKDKGRGLGLAGAYSIIKKHGGQISVTSKMGVGTSFWIFLPALDGTVTGPATGENVLKGTGRILIMDDEEDLLAIMGETLSTLGYEVALARDGREAIEIYMHSLNNEHPFDLVVMDLTIPGGMGGKQTIRELLNKDPQVKAIVASGYSNDPVMANFGKYGFKAAVQKPFTIETLSRVVKEVLG